MEKQRQIKERVARGLARAQACARQHAEMQAARLARAKQMHEVQAHACGSRNETSLQHPKHFGSAHSGRLHCPPQLITIRNKLALLPQFRLAQQRPGTPLYEKLSREFEARCRAEEEESQRRYEEAAAAKRAYVIVSVDLGR